MLPERPIAYVLELLLKITPLQGPQAPSYHLWLHSWIVQRRECKVETIKTKLTDLQVLGNLEDLMQTRQEVCTLWGMSAH